MNFPKFKFTKTGKLLEKSKYGGWNVVEDNRLATFVTPSLKEILKVFGKNILKLKAKGEKLTASNKTELKHLGIKISNNKSNYCVIDYDRYFDKVNKHNDLTKGNIEKILNYLDENNIKDCSVEFLIVKIDDKDLKNIIEDHFKFELNSKTFYATFKLQMCEGEIDRDLWESTPYNKEVLAPLRFKRSMLHCIKLIDDGQIWNTKKSRRKYFIDWQPKKNSLNFPTSPKEIAHSLMINFEPYGYVKQYRLGKDEKMILSKMYS